MVFAERARGLPMWLSCQPAASDLATVDDHDLCRNLESLALLPMLSRVLRYGGRQGVSLMAVCLSSSVRPRTPRMEREAEPHKYSELPIDVPPADPVDPVIDELVEEILNLNIIEYGQFLKRIQLRSGISDDLMLSRLGNTFLVSDPNRPDDEAGPVEEEPDDAAPAAAAAEKQPEVKVKEFFDVKLGAVDAKSKIKVIKEIRTITNLGLKEAKELVEKAPVVIKTGIKKDEAEKLKKVLVDSGAEVEIL